MTNQSCKVFHAYEYPLPPSRSQRLYLLHAILCARKDMLGAEIQGSYKTYPQPPNRFH